MKDIERRLNELEKKLDILLNRDKFEFPINRNKEREYLLEKAELENNQRKKGDNEALNDLSSGDTNLEQGKEKNTEQMPVKEDNHADTNLNGEKTNDKRRDNKAKRGRPKQNKETTEIPANKSG